MVSKPELASAMVLSSSRVMTIHSALVLKTRENLSSPSESAFRIRRLSALGRSLARMPMPTII